MSDEYTNEIEKIRKEAIESMKKDFKERYKGYGKSSLEELREASDELKKQLVDLFKINWDEAFKGDRWTIPNTSTSTEKKERENLTFEKLKKIIDGIQGERPYDGKWNSEKYRLELDAIKEKGLNAINEANKPINSCICCRHWNIEKEKTLLLGNCGLSSTKERTDYGFSCSGWEGIKK